MHIHMKYMHRRNQMDTNNVKGTFIEYLHYEPKPC